jgi:hypothetical protein
MSDEKKAALAAHLKVSADTIEECSHSDDCFECESEPGEYRVLTESEREEAAGEALESYIDECLFGQIKADFKGQESLLETFERYFDRAAWKRDTLINNGYGHTLSGYDGNEREERIDGTWYYIYRVN